jgi:enoyl-CoA hydratase/carnithine racemase
MNEAWKLAQRIAQQGPIAVALAKQAINLTQRTDLETGLESELQGVMKTFTTEDQKEGMTAFVERRKPEFKRQ